MPGIRVNRLCDTFQGIRNIGDANLPLVSVFLLKLSKHTTGILIKRNSIAQFPFELRIPPRRFLFLGQCPSVNARQRLQKYRDGELVVSERNESAMGPTVVLYQTGIIYLRPAVDV